MPNHYNNPGDGNVASFAPQLFNPMEGLNLGLDPAAQATNAGGIFGNIDLFGGTDAQGNQSVGALQGGIGALTGLGNLALGYQQYGLAKDELGFQKEQARINNQNQMTTLNNLIAGQAENRRIATGTGPTGAEFVASSGIRL